MQKMHTISIYSSIEGCTIVVQTTLFEDGLEQLNSTFRELLKQHSKRVPDGTLIDIANASSEEGVYN